MSRVYGGLSPYELPGRRDLRESPGRGVPERRDNTNTDGSAAAIAEERKRAHNARPGRMSFGKRSFKHIYLAVESARRLGKSSEEILDQIPVNIVA